MAESNYRFEKGVGSIKGVGEFFVTEQCIDCDLCRQMAPGIFKRKCNGMGGISFVSRQPASESEYRQTAGAVDACPVGAIQRATFDALVDA